MGKLFSFEGVTQGSSESGEDDQLLIDKVIQKNKIDQNSPVVSDELKKQRAALKTQIEASLAQSQAVKPETDDSEEDSSADDESDEGSEDGAQPVQDNGGKDTEQPTDDSSEEPSDKDDSNAKDGEEKPDEKKAEDNAKKDEESVESFLKPYTANWSSVVNASAGIRCFMDKYKADLTDSRLPPFSFEDLPLVYTKQQVVEFLNKLSFIIDETIANTSKVVNAHQESFLSLDKRITLLRADIEREEKTFCFNAKVTEDMLVLLAVDKNNSVDTDKSTEILLTANKDFFSVLAGMLKTPLNEVPSVLLSNNFVKTDLKNDYRYGSLLPGLADMRASIAPYRSYLSDDLDETDFFVIRPSGGSGTGIYESNIEHKEAAMHILDNALELVTVSVATLDCLRKIVTVLNDGLSNVKVTMQGVQTGTLSEIKAETIDRMVENVIKNRLAAWYAVSLSGINISYLTGSLLYVAARYGS